jgi:hypothetical protein
MVIFYNQLYLCSSLSKYSSILHEFLHFVPLKTKGLLQELQNFGSNSHVKQSLEHYLHYIPSK